MANISVNKLDQALIYILLNSYDCPGFVVGYKNYQKICHVWQGVAKFLFRRYLFWSYFIQYLGY